MMWTLLIGFVTAFALVFTLFVFANYALGVGTALGTLLRYRDRRRALGHVAGYDGEALPPITIIVPMYNEGPVCVASVRSFLSVLYPRVDIFIVNDGSRDDTLELLQHAYDLEPVAMDATADLPTARHRGTYRSTTHPNLVVFDKDNGGRSDALNHGLRYCRTPLFCVVDADSLLDRGALKRMVLPFMTDSTTVAVGGNVRIVNDSVVKDGVVQEVVVPRGFIARCQALEYLRAFVTARIGWNRLNTLMIISGAMGLFRREPVVTVGGFDNKTIGEDMELTLRLHRHYRDLGQPYRIDYVPDAVAWTECPSTASDLGGQRDRWHRGLAEILMKHRGMMLNPRYGRIGLVGMPYFLIVEFLGPVVEAIGYIVLVGGLLFGWIAGTQALLMTLAALGLGVLYSVAVVLLEEMSFRRYTRLTDVASLLWTTVADNFGYRQMTVFWRLRGIWKYLRKDGSWGEMKRVGFSTAEATA